jgi:hypothetical protein
MGAVFLAADISALISSGVTAFALGFWPAALLGGAMIGCYYLVAKYFKDTQLQGYFKNFPLSDYSLPPKISEQPHEYIHRLVTQRAKTIINPWIKTLMVKEYRSYHNFEKAYTALLDIIVPSMVILQPAKVENSRYRANFNKANLITNRFEAHIYSAQNIAYHDDLEIRAWFYPNGIKAPLKEGSRFEITTFTYKFPKPDPFNRHKDEIIPNCIVNFGLPPQFYSQYREYHNGEVLFTCRIRVEDQEYISKLCFSASLKTK